MFLDTDFRSQDLNCLEPDSAARANVTRAGAHRRTLQGTWLELGILSQNTETSCCKMGHTQRSLNRGMSRQKRRLRKKILSGLPGEAGGRSRVRETGICGASLDTAAGL